LVKFRRLRGRFHHRRGSLRKWLAIALIVLGVTGGGAYYYVTRPQRLAAITGQLLEQLTGAQVHIDSATFTLSGAIELRGVALTVPGLPDQRAQLFDAEQMLLQVDPWEIMHGRFAATQLILVRPVLSLTQVSDEEFNFTVLQKLRKTESVASVPVIPRIYVQQGRLRFGEIHDGHYQNVGALDVAGNLSPDPGRPGVYHYELYRFNPAEPAVASGVRLRGAFDLANLEVNAEMSDFAFANPHRNMLPRQIRQWWDRFEPSGSLQDVKFDYDPKTGPKGEVRVDGVSLTLPHLLADDYKARMTDVSGVFRFDADRITIENLVGNIEGLSYRINGTIDGYGAEAPFRLAVQTLPFRITEKPDYKNAMPMPVQKIFAMLTPVGWLSVSMELHRDKPGEKIGYQGTAHVLSGNDVLAEFPRKSRPTDLTEADLVSHGHYFKFPYELNNCRGLLTFNSQGVEIKNLTGDSGGGGTVTITGTIAPPGPDAAIDLVVTAVNMPFDEKLHSALPEGQQRSLDVFFNKPGWQLLHDHGYLVTTAEHDAAQAERLKLQTQIKAVKDPADPQRAALDGQLKKAEADFARPVFNLGGRGNMVVKVQRPPGDDQPFNLHTTIELVDANVVFEFFPYPITVDRGTLIIDGDRTTFENISARGLYGGTGGIAGTVDTVQQGDDKKVVPNIALHAEALPLVPVLFDSLGEFRGKWLRDLGLSGPVDVDMKLFRSAKEIDFDAAVKLAGNAATPTRGKYTLTDLRGQLNATLNTVKLHHISGKHGDSTITVDGGADWTDREKVTVKLDVAATDMRFEDHVLDLVAAFSDQAEGLRDAWDRYKPAGRFDADVSYNIDGVAPDPRVTMELKPRSLEFTHADRRVVLKDVGGSVSVEPGRVKLHELTAAFEGGKIKLNGDASYGENPEANLKLTASGDSVSPTLRSLLPQRADDFLKALQFTGKYELKAQKLVIRPRAAEGRWLDVDATLRLTKGAAQIGVAVSDFDGGVHLRAGANANDDYLAIVAEVEADRLVTLGRVIEGFKMQLRSAGANESEAVGQLLIPTMSGRLGKGMIAGSGGVSTTDGQFTMQIALSDADLPELVTGSAIAPPPMASEAPHETADPNAAAKPLSHAVARQAQDRPLSGQVSASLALQGSWKDASQLRGRGSLIVRDGQLYGIPLSFGLFRITHLALPVTDTFNAATLGYYIRDNRFVFEHIQLDAPSMRLTGAGSMNMTSGDIDITLTTSNPKGWELGPLTALLAKFRDQLLTIRISGTLQKPVTQAEQFSGIAKAWRDVVGPDKKKE
jgi:hypothetical protein